MALTHHGALGTPPSGFVAMRVLLGLFEAALFAGAHTDASSTLRSSLII
jgi:hypothetical protein